MMKTSILRLATCVAFSAAALPLFAQTLTPCPGDLSKVAKCYTGTDQNSAQYWIVIPEKWNQTLVMHAHGGPRLSPITTQSNVEDVLRFSVNIRQGFAWAGSTYRRPGYGVRMAAEDTENLRKIFIKSFGKPNRTILHGQSWGGNVAAKGIELYGRGDDGSRNYDGVVITNGMLAGGTRNYIHRADLRAVYQYYCNNHPLPSEPQYQVWMGLPADSTMTSKDLETRINDCTGVKLPAAQRSEQQKRNLADILAVIPVPERTLVSHINWATFMFRDLVQRVLGGRNPFSNRDVVYRGSKDDAALNRGVIRFDADPQAVAQLSNDSDMLGKFDVPLITMHAIDDPTAMVEYESDYRDVVTRAGNQARLLQTFTREHDHSKLADAEYAALFNSLVQWIETGTKPDVQKIAAACAEQSARFDGGCHFDPSYVPASMSSRISARGDVSATPK